MLWVILLFLPVMAQSPNEALTAPGQANYNMHKAVASAESAPASADTTLGVWVGAVDKIRLYAKYASRNDSINVLIWLDIAPVNDPDFFVPWAAIDSAIVSGTADTTRYTSIASPPDDALYGRLRTVPRMASGDTVDVTTKMTITRLPGPRFQ